MRRLSQRIACVLEPSKTPSKKFDVRLLGKTVSFGAKGMSDFTLHKDPLRKERYLERHAKNEHWEDVLTAGCWSRWLLWNKPSLRASARDMERRFGLRISFARVSRTGAERSRGGGRTRTTLHGGS
jgi:hypothetical protein